MTSVLNLVGFILVAVGSCTAMWGIFKQANGYYTFKATVWTFAQVIFSLCKVFVTQGPTEASKMFGYNLNNTRVENRAQSLLGFFAVFTGFVLQLAGATVLYIATLTDAAEKAHPH